MNLTPDPEVVIPIVAPAAGHLYESLRKGIAFADELQPDEDREPWYWSHSARFRALQELTAKAPKVGDEYQVRPRVPNAGIHLTFGRLHKARVVRSLGGTTPAPGRNRARRRDWVGVPVQGQLALGNNDGTIPPLSMIIDWQDVAGEPVIHIGLPRAGWTYQTKPLLHWRVPLLDPTADYSGLAFESSDDGSGDGLALVIDPAEAGADGG